MTRSDKSVIKLTFLSHWYQQEVQSITFNLTFKFQNCGASRQKWNGDPLKEVGSKADILIKWSWKDSHCFSHSRLFVIWNAFYIKVMYSSKWAVGNNNNKIECTPYNVNKIKQNKLIKRPLCDVFSSYLVNFQATLSPFCQRGSLLMLNIFWTTNNGK